MSAAYEVSNGIDWPAQFGDKSTVVQNECLINASADLIWFFLTNAKEWHKWYSNASDVELKDTRAGWVPFLQQGSKFSWTTFGTFFKAEVVQFAAQQRLMWIAKTCGFTACHVWSIIPLESGEGNRVVSHLNRVGMMDRVYNLFGCKEGLSFDIHFNHDAWLRALKKHCEMCQQIQTRQTRLQASGPLVMMSNNNDALLTVFKEGGRPDHQAAARVRMDSTATAVTDKRDAHSQDDGFEREDDET